MSLDWGIETEPISSETTSKLLHVRILEILHENQILKENKLSILQWMFLKSIFTAIMERIS